MWKGRAPTPAWVPPSLQEDSLGLRSSDLGTGLSLPPSVAWDKSVVKRNHSFEVLAFFKREFCIMWL